MEDNDSTRSIDAVPTGGEDPAWLRRLPRFLRLSWRATMRTINHDGLEMAGHMSFTAFTSLFPFLIFLAALAGYLGSSEAAAQITDLMFRFTPDDVASTLAPAVNEVMSNRSGSLVTFSIVVTLWVASNGIETLRLALTRAYEITEWRSLWLRRVQSIVFVVVGAGFVFVISFGILVGPIVWQILEQILGLGGQAWLAWLIGRYAFAGSLLFIGLVALHHWLPHHQWSFAAVLPGIFLTLLLWLISATGFSFYLGNIADYTVMYGSLGGVVITLFFFYITAVLFIWGAEFNAVLRESELKKRVSRVMRENL